MNPKTVEELKKGNISEAIQEALQCWMEKQGTGQ
jgi:hypothetical protein